MCIFHVKIMYIFSALYDICYTQIYSTGLNNSSFRPVMFLFQQNNFQWKVDSCVFGLTELQTTGVIWIKVSVFYVEDPYFCFTCRITDAHIQMGCVL